MDEEPESNEVLGADAQQFYGFIRRHLVCLLFFFFLYTISYGIIRYMKTRSDNDELYAGDEDYAVYRISTWICTNSLSISIGAVTLLPFSVVGAEVLQLYPDNFYLKWLNFSLINTLWSYVFLWSNLSLFVLLPFSYFFIESQGFSLTLRLQSLTGSLRHPLLARFYETLIVCSLVIVLLVGIADCLHAHLFYRQSRIWYSLLYFSSMAAPLLYSLASLLGVSLLLLSVPLGFSRLFDFVSSMLMGRGGGGGGRQQRRKSLKPEPLTKEINNNKNDQLAFAPLDLERLQKMADDRKSKLGKIAANSSLPNGYCSSCCNFPTTAAAATDARNNINFSPAKTPIQKMGKQRKSIPTTTFSSSSSSSYSTSNGNIAALKIASTKPNEERRRRGQLFFEFFAASTRHSTGGVFLTSVFKQLGNYWESGMRVLEFLKCPVFMLALFVLTVLSILMVISNTLQLLFGFRHLPAYVQYLEEYRHTLGIFGAVIEVTIILYIMTSSLIGVYSIPFIRRIIPQKGRTSLTSIIINCMLISLLSSALPILVRTLGITTFDLLGDYGRINWISNLTLVLSYNIFFASVSIYCIIYKFTEPVRKELLRRVSTIVNRKRLYADDECAASANSSSSTDLISNEKKND